MSCCASLLAGFHAHAPLRPHVASRAPAPLLGLPGAPRNALSSLLQDAGYSGVPTRVEELSAGFCNWVYLCEYEGPPESMPASCQGAASVDGAEVGDADGTAAGTAEEARPPMRRRRRVASTARTVVAKLFSPLAKLRLTPAMRGAADASASDEGLGPRVLYSSSDGLVTDFISGRTLTESDIHAPAAHRGVLRALAPRLAALHSVRLPAGAPVVLWHFMDEMLAQIEVGGAALPRGVSAAAVGSEVRRMRSRFEALELPVVNGHGDLKPSNLMIPASTAAAAPSASASAAAGSTGSASAGAAPLPTVTFIDFELAGAHYRGYDLYKLFYSQLFYSQLFYCGRYDLYKLFRTSGHLSHKNMRAFLRDYLRCLAEADQPPVGQRRTRVAKSDLREIHAEALAFEPLTWLEAAVFFFFAMATYPAKAHEWQPLALDRWESYLASAHLVEQDGPATRELLAARHRKRALRSRKAPGWADPVATGPFSPQQPEPNRADAED